MGPEGWTITVSDLKDKSCTITYREYYDWGDGFEYAAPEQHKVIYKNGNWIVTSGRMLKLTSFDKYKPSF